MKEFQEAAEKATQAYEKHAKLVGFWQAFGKDTRLSGYTLGRT